MGQSISNMKNKQFEEKYFFLTENQFRNIFIIKNKQTNFKYILKKLTFDNITRYKGQLKLNDQIKHLVINPYLITSNIVFTGQQQQFCSNSYCLYKLYLIPQRTLLNQILAKRINNINFTEEDIWSILVSCIKALADLENISIPHQRLSSDYIFIQQSGKIKIPEPNALSILSYYRTALEKGLEKNIYLSPQLYQSLLIKEDKIFYNPYKSDVFTLGIIILELCLLNDMKELYKVNNFQQVLMERMIEKVGLKYSNSLKSMLKLMLEVNETNRPDFIDLQKHIAKEQENILILDSIQEKYLYGKSSQKNEPEIQSEKIKKFFKYKNITQIAQNPIQNQQIHFQLDKNYHYNQTEQTKINQKDFFKYDFNNNTYALKKPKYTMQIPKQHFQKQSLNKCHPVYNLTVLPNSSNKYANLVPKRSYGQPETQSNSWLDFQQSKKKCLQIPAQFNKGYGNTTKTKSFYQKPKKYQSYIQYGQAPVNKSSQQDFKQRELKFNFQNLNHQNQNQLVINKYPINSYSNLKTGANFNAQINNKQTGQQLNPSIQEKERVSYLDVSGSNYLIENKRMTNFNNYQQQNIKPLINKDNFEAEQTLYNKQSKDCHQIRLPRMQNDKIIPFTSKQIKKEMPKITPYYPYTPYTQDYHSNIKKANASIDYKLNQPIFQPYQNKQSIQYLEKNKYNFDFSQSNNKGYLNRFLISSKQINQDNSQAMYLQNLGKNFSVKKQELSPINQDRHQQNLNSELVQIQKDNIQQKQPTLKNLQDKKLQLSKNSLQQLIKDKGYTHIMSQKVNLPLNNNKYQVYKKIVFEEPKDCIQQQNMNIIKKEDNYKNKQRSSQQNYFDDIKMRESHYYSSQKNNYKKLLQDQYIYVNQIHKDGARFQGFKKNGKRQSQGTYWFAEGGRYEGNWHNHVINGYGKLYYKNNQLAYQGNWIDQMFDGQGKLFNQYPQILDQQFNYWNLQQINNIWIKYEGGFKNDLKNGCGKLFLSNGQVFTGNFKEDEADGYGQYKTIRNQIINGIWKSNILQQILK